MLCLCFHSIRQVFTHLPTRVDVALLDFLGFEPQDLLFSIQNNIYFRQQYPFLSAQDHAFHHWQNYILASVGKVRPSV